MNIAILASGRGSNAKRILECVRDSKIKNVNVVGVISDREDAPVLEIAKSFGVRSIYLDPKRAGAKFSEEGARDYIDMLRDMEVELIVLAGFMRILPKEVISAFERKIINLHPSLLPSFKGRDGIGDAFRYGVKVSGCTVHYVSEGVDEGEIISQRVVKIEDTDTLESFEKKIHEAEHILLPETINMLCRGF